MTFYISATPDKGASDAAVDKLVFLFNPVTNTSNTYYIDNIRITSGVPRDNLVLANVWEDYDANRNLTLKSATGTYSPAINNPSVGGVNTSAKAARYVRSAAQQWDLLIFNKANAVVDGKALKERRQKIAIDIYTDAPSRNGNFSRHGCKHVGDWQKIIRQDVTAIIRHSQKFRMHGILFTSRSLHHLIQAHRIISSTTLQCCLIQEN